ncbi:MAG: glycosyltransferase [Bacillota bacterium]|nr:glycosyltransferase [Bacillota bacterium]
MLAHLDLSWIVMALAGWGLLVLLVRIWRWLFGAYPRVVRKPSVSLLVVARNKETQIEGLVRGLLSIGQRRAGVEIIIVDDRSTDQTPAILERLARRNPSLRVVRMADMGSGVSSAVEVGLFLCSSPLVVMLNVDGQANPRALLEATEHLLGAGGGTERNVLAAARLQERRGTVRPFQGKERAQST